MATSAFVQAQQVANARNQARLNQATALYDSIIAQNEGGEKAPLMTQVNSQLALGGRRAMSAGMQNLVSAGLSGTSVAASLGNKYEEEVAAPARLSALDTIAQRLSAAKIGKANLLQGVEESGPDPSLLANLTQAANSGGSNYGNYGQSLTGNQGYVWGGSTTKSQPAGGGVTYGSGNNMGKYQPAQVAVKNGASTKNLAASVFNNITYGSNNKSWSKPVTVPMSQEQNYTPIKAAGYADTYVDW